MKYIKLKDLAKSEDASPSVSAPMKFSREKIVGTKALKGYLDAKKVPEDSRLKVAEDEAATFFPFVFSTGSKDRDKERLLQEGWDLKNYMANPVILWGHQWGSAPIGKAVAVYLSEGKLKGIVQIDDSELNPQGRLVKHQLEQGFLSTGSVGFHVKDWGLDEEGDEIEIVIKEQELLEFSILPIPSLPDAKLEEEEKSAEPEDLAQEISDHILKMEEDLKDSILKVVEKRLEDALKAVEKPAEDTDSKDKQNINTLSDVKEAMQSLLAEGHFKPQNPSEET